MRLQSGFIVVYNIWGLQRYYSLYLIETFKQTLKHISFVFVEIFSLPK